MKWSFYRQHPTDTVRNPISGEFFSQEAVGDVADAIVREGVQNSLDARRTSPDGARHVAKVRIFLSGKEKALTPERSKYWFSSLWPHIEAPGNGLRDQPTPKDSCPFLVYEDFGTTGLTGDPDAHEVVTGKANNFLNFFRAEGHSDKGSEDRGSWGVGKTVFPRASRISSFFGFTVRESDSKGLLLGRSILKFHKVAGVSYKSDGYCGYQRTKDDFVLAADGAGFLEQFRKDFGVQRKHQTGLSIAVPFYDVEGEEAITTKKVIGAILRGFFYPILLGHLEVVVADPLGEHTFDKASVLDGIKQHMSEDTTGLHGIVQLTQWALSTTPEEHLGLMPPAPQQAQKWDSALMPDDVMSRVKEALTLRKRLALRVPLAVQFKTGGPVPTFCRIYLEYAEEPRVRPVFIRDELIISQVRSPYVSQLRALVLIDDKPLANLLRDAETPAHTQWSPDTGNFKAKYKYGPGVISFVRNSVAEIARIVRQSESEPDPLLAIDFFSLPATPDDPNAVTVPPKGKPAQKGEPEPKPPFPPIPKRPQRFRMSDRAGGFSIKAGDEGAPKPDKIVIQAAYSLRKGNPLKKYHEADFDLEELNAQGRIKCKGVQIEEAKRNRLVVAVKSLPFEIDVDGFDLNRDLYVKADAKEVQDAD